MRVWILHDGRAEVTEVLSAPGVIRGTVDGGSMFLEVLVAV